MLLQIQGVNGMVSRWGYFGLVATPDGRQLRDVAGQQLQVGISELWKSIFNGRLYRSVLPSHAGGSCTQDTAVGRLRRLDASAAYRAVQAAAKHSQVKRAD